MNTLENLREKDIPMAYINNQWVPARPLNYRKKYMPMVLRIKHAWEVFMCRAEAFTWPVGQ